MSEDILITLDPDDHHATHVGRLSDGRQFFLTEPFDPAGDASPGCGFVALFLFDAEGTLVDHSIENLGPRAKLDEAHAKRVFARLLDSVGSYEIGSIDFHPFKIRKFDLDFGIIQTEDDPDDPDEEPSFHIEPGDYMAFYAPYDGDYDT